MKISPYDTSPFLSALRPINSEMARFSVEGGQRIITITNRLPQENKYMQLKVAAHELNHARMYDKLIQRHGTIRGHEIWSREIMVPRLYAREEIIVERAAQIMIRSVFEGKLSGRNLRRLTEALDESDAYISYYKNLMGAL